MRSTVEYTRFSKKFRGSLRSVQFWKADDHVVCISESTVAQNYRRFYFNDIQAIIVQRSNVSAIITIILFFLTLILGGITYVNKGFDSPAGALIGGLSIAAMLAIAIINLARGPMGKVHIQSAAGVFKIPLNFRIRQISKAIGEIYELAMQWQTPRETPEVQNQTENPQPSPQE
ncbi:MAG: hypothetical protein GF398_11070 [Chitinivibrionales bacterium]|nr:hypothetical protein [Chitinivibrionales bacterium]